VPGFKGAKPDHHACTPDIPVAEKGADLIPGNTPLLRSDVPYYQLRNGSPLYPPGDPRNENGAVS